MARKCTFALGESLWRRNLPGEHSLTSTTARYSKCGRISGCMETWTRTSTIAKYGCSGCRGEGPCLRSIIKDMNRNNVVTFGVCYSLYRKCGIRKYAQHFPKFIPTSYRCHKVKIQHTLFSFPYFSKDSTSFITFSSLSKNAPNSSESTSGMAPADAATATTGAAASSTGALLEKADLILYKMKRPKYPPRMAAATFIISCCVLFV